MLSEILCEELCEESEVLDEEVGESEGEDGGVRIFWTYAAGTKPCFPFSSTFHQSCQEKIISIDFEFVTSATLSTVHKYTLTQYFQNYVPCLRSLAE